MKTLRTLLVVVFTFTAFSLSAQLYDKKWTISAGAYFNDFVVTQEGRLLTDAHWNHKGVPIRVSGGFYLAKHWTAIAQFSTVKLDNPTFLDGNDLYFDVDLGVQWRFLYERVFDPYLYATVGGKSLNKEFYFGFDGGLGFNIWFTRSFAFYAEAAYGGIMGVDPKEFTTVDENGLPLKDANGDELYPDAYDGTYNLTDNLNYSFGFRVCPGKEADTDGDGIADRDDACPDEFGVAEFDGCPDTDGDGIQDSEDACPTEAGKPEFNGCPDRDNDGIIDSEDACPDDAGPAEFNGCPDSDGDGIIDKNDKCPTEPGVPEFDGCPPPPPPPLDLTIVVYFDINKTILDNDDKALLDKLADQLMNSEESTIIANGYTDNTGADTYNQKLSERRAKAVKDYLVGKGIAAERITTKGYGETNPAATNDTQEGRAKNRRVEFK